jgi:hypothetical protein
MKLSTVITFTAATVVLNGICLHASNNDANPANKISIDHDFSFDDASIIGNISETDALRDTNSLIGNDADTNLPWSRHDHLGVRSSFTSLHHLSLVLNITSRKKNFSYSFRPNFISFSEHDSCHF